MFRIVGGLDEVQSKVESQLYSFFGVPEIPQDYTHRNRCPNSIKGNSALSMPTELSPPRDRWRRPIQHRRKRRKRSQSIQCEDPLAGETPSTDETDQQSNASIRRSLREVTAKGCVTRFRVDRRRRLVTVRLRGGRSCGVDRITFQSHLRRSDQTSGSYSYCDPLVDHHLGQRTAGDESVHVRPSR